MSVLRVFFVAFSCDFLRWVEIRFNSLEYLATHIRHTDFSNYLPRFRLLLRFGADAKKVSSDGESALDVAASSRAPGMDEG